MNKAKTVSVLLAGLLAGAGAFAQTASATADGPVKAGEASTMTHGRPNMATSNYSSGAPVTSASGVIVTPAASSTTVMGAAPATVVVPATPVVVTEPARALPDGGASATVNVPDRAGEISTMTNGRPNLSTHNPVVSERYAVVMEPDVQYTPQQAGEASTMVGGRPNANPNDAQFRR